MLLESLLDRMSIAPPVNAGQGCKGKGQRQPMMMQVSSSQILGALISGDYESTRDSGSETGEQILDLLDLGLGGPAFRVSRLVLVEGHEWNAS